MKKVYIPTTVLAIGVELIKEYTIIQDMDEHFALAVGKDNIVQIISLKGAFENLEDAKQNYLENIKALVEQVEQQWSVKSEQPHEETSKETNA